MTKQITRTEVREIAREEVSKANKIMIEKMEEIAKVSESNKEVLERLERLLLGEVGVEEEDTLKARANFAYLYAKRNTDSKIIDRAKPALRWFEDMAYIEPGCKESKLDTLGRVLGWFTKAEWLLALFGVSTVTNFVIIGKFIYDLIVKNKL